jgi:hypothetical protein
MDRVIVFTIIIVIFAGFLFWGFQSGFFVKLFSGPVQPASTPSGIILFYGADCPHCKNVEAFIATNSIDQKVKFTQLEVPFYNKTSPQLAANGELALQIAKECKLDTINGVSIPLLYDGSGKCLMGDTDVINFLKTQAGIK